MSKGCFAAAMALWMSAVPLSGQVITGLGKDVKAPAEGPVTTALAEDWTSWTDEEMVSRLVHEPLKRIASTEDRPQVLLAMKRHMIRAEESVRHVLSSREGGELGDHAARELLLGILVEYAAALEELHTG